MARMSDGSSRDVTTAAAWESSNTRVATVSSTGNVSVVANGELDVRATYQGVSGSMHLTVSLPANFTVTGIVTEAGPNGQRIAGARVQVVGGSHTFTDAQGTFTLADTPAGRAILEVTKDGYQMYSNELTVNQDLQVTITLSRATGS
jgi:hypothetical protein